MEQTATSTTWIQDARKRGLVLGVIHVVIFLVIYMTVPSLIAGFLYLLLIIFLNIGYSVYSGIQWRNELGGFMAYGDAFKYALVLLLFDALVGLVFGMVFLTIDPSYPETMAQLQFDSSLYWAQKFGAPEATLEDMRSKFDLEKMAANFSYFGMLKGAGIGLIFDAIGAAIIALFVRKNKPETF